MGELAMPLQVLEGTAQSTNHIHVRQYSGQRHQQGLPEGRPPEADTSDGYADCCVSENIHLTGLDFANAAITQHNNAVAIMELKSDRAFQRTPGLSGVLGDQLAVQANADAVLA